MWACVKRARVHLVVVRHWWWGYFGRKTAGAPTGRVPLDVCTLSPKYAISEHMAASCP